MKDELLFRIALTLQPEIGDIGGKRLIAYCGGVEAVFREKKHNLQKIPGIRQKAIESLLRNNLLKRAEKEIEFINRYNIRPLYFLDDDYPTRLKHCDDGPMMLYMKGNVDLNCGRILSVVGTRQASDYGKMITHQLIRDLSAANVIIVSGLAYGIDSIAHRASLENGIPTVGVLAHGLEQIYPRAHRGLAEKMLDKGGLLTEFVSHTEMDPSYFPRRNRIVAGMSDAVVVVESARKGGAIITADIAISYNREVIALPGRATDAYSAGCNYLIKTNRAALAESAKDIIELMRWDEEKRKRTPQKQLFIPLTVDEEAIVKLLREHGESGIDFICLHSKLKQGKVASTLLNLEFNGIVKGLPGKRYALL